MLIHHLRRLGCPSHNYATISFYRSSISKANIKTTALSGSHLASRHLRLAVHRSQKGGWASRRSQGRVRTSLRLRRASLKETPRWWRSNATLCHRSGDQKQNKFSMFVHVVKRKNVLINWKKLLNKVLLLLYYYYYYYYLYYITITIKLISS